MEYKFSRNVLLEKMRTLGYEPGITTDKKILVIRDLETALFFAPENTVVYITDDSVNYARFNMFTESDCGDDDLAILIDGTAFHYEHNGETVETEIIKDWKNLQQILEVLPE